MDLIWVMICLTVNGELLFEFQNLAPIDFYSETII